MWTFCRRAKSFFIGHLDSAAHEPEMQENEDVEHLGLDQGSRHALCRVWCMSLCSENVWVVGVGMFFRRAPLLQFAMCAVHILFFDIVFFMFRPTSCRKGVSPNGDGV